MNGHELVGKSGHGAADADAADVRAAADAAHPAALADVALHHRPPAAELHDARLRAEFVGEIALLIIAAAIAALVQRFGKKPCRPQKLVERNHRRAARGLAQQIEQRLHEIIGLNRTARHVDDRDARLRFPLPAEIIGKAHRAGRIALHGVNAAVGRAGARGDDRPRFRRQPVDPVAGRDRLARWSGRGRNAAQEPSALFFSSGIEPSMTRMNGPIRSSAASWKNCMKSSPTS